MNAPNQALSWLAPASDLDEMVARHVRFEDFARGPVESRLSQLLLSGDRPRALLVGEAGTGKSSTASAATADAAERPVEEGPTPRKAADGAVFLAEQQEAAMVNTDHVAEAASQLGPATR